jgi:hypothetical protein
VNIKKARSSENCDTTGRKEETKTGNRWGNLF